MIRKAERVGHEIAQIGHCEEHDGHADQGVGNRDQLAEACLRGNVPISYTRTYDKRAKMVIVNDMHDDRLT